VRGESVFWEFFCGGRFGCSLGDRENSVGAKENPFPGRVPGDWVGGDFVGPQLGGGFPFLEPLRPVFRKGEFG